MTPLAADRAEIGGFIGAIFRHAEGHVSLRSFEHEPGKPPVEIRAQQINGEGLEPVVAVATGCANRAARHPRPVVFAPITSCTFTNDWRAAEADIHHGVALAVELDQHPAQARTRLEGLLGPATAVFLSGGEWIDGATGAVQPKLHLYWRLSEPTRDPIGHARLKRARALATAIVGGDASAVPLPHPLRCPGSWHRKGAPRLCRCDALRPEVEVDLDDVAEKLGQAAMLALGHASGEDAERLRSALASCGRARARQETEHDPDARDADLEALADAIPNNDEPWSEYRNIGLGFYAASDGSAAGLNAYDRWARKSAKYTGTAADWTHFHASKPGRTGTGALVRRARRADPGFRLPGWGPAREQDDTAAEQDEPAADERAGSANRSTGGGSWPEPDMGIIAPHRAPPPELPLAVFGPFWSAWIASAAAAKGAPPDFVAAALLPAVGCLIVRQRRASPWAGWAEPAVLWAAAVGPPSSGKSPAIDAVADLVRALEAELNEDFDERRRRWKTDKLEAEVLRAKWEDEAKGAVKKGYKPPLMPPDCEEPDPPHERRLLVNDVTPEKLVRLSAANPFGLVLQRDELAGWLGGMDRYNGAGSERALWLEAFGARPLALDRVKEAKPIRTDALAIGILGGIQPDRLATLVLAGDDDGLAARILYVWPDAGPPRRPDSTADDTTARDALRRLAQLDRGLDGPAVLPMTPAAAGELQRWRVDVAAMEAETAGLFLSWLGKLPGLAVRLALVLEHLWWAGDHPDAAAPAAIGEDATLASIGFLEAYALPMAKRAFGDAAWPQAERDAAALGKWLLAQSPLPLLVNARALRRKAALHTREPGRYDGALGELESAGWVRARFSRGGGKGGRLSKDWAVNPALAQGRE